MTKLTIDALKQPDRLKRRFKDITLPGGFTARIQALREGEKARFEDGLTDRQGKPNAKRIRNLRGLLIASCWVDDNGDRVMSEDDVFADWWQNQDGAFTSAFFRECKSFAGFDDDDFEELEASVKNSENGHA